MAPRWFGLKVETSINFASLPGAICLVLENSNKFGLVHNSTSNLYTSHRDARAGGADTGLSEAIWPGISGGRYKPLADQDVYRIHDTALRILEEVGLRGATPQCIETVIHHGGSMTDDGRLRMPARMVEDTLATAGRRFKLYAQKTEQDLSPWETRIHLGTSGAAVHMIDSEIRQVRESTLRDLYDTARLAND